MNRAEMAAAYAELVGYDPIADDPSMTDDELQELLDDARKFHAQAQVQS